MELAPGEAEPKPARVRACWVGAPDMFKLEQFGFLLFQAFGEVPYLVGSCLERRDYRDVDVRIIMADAKYETLFGTGCGHLTMFWSLLCTSISEYMGKLTGLPIDFQIQKRSNIKAADWDKSRQPLGIFPTNTGPAWRDL